jgi:hypothetical protein
LEAENQSITTCTAVNANVHAQVRAVGNQFELFAFHHKEDVN